MARTVVRGGGGGSSTECHSSQTRFPHPPTPCRSFYDHDFGMLPGTSLPRLVRRLKSLTIAAQLLCCFGCDICCFSAVTLSRMLRPPPTAQVDMGQCNDAYSAIVVASKLAEVRCPYFVYSACVLVAGKCCTTRCQANECH